MVPAFEDVLDSEWQEADGTRGAPSADRSRTGACLRSAAACPRAPASRPMSNTAVRFSSASSTAGASGSSRPSTLDPQQGVCAAPDDVERIVDDAQRSDRRVAAKFDVVGGAEARRRGWDVVGRAGHAAPAVGLDPQVPRNQGRHPGRISRRVAFGAGLPGKPAAAGLIRGRQRIQDARVGDVIEANEVGAPSCACAALGAITARSPAPAGRNARRCAQTPATRPPTCRARPQAAVARIGVSSRRRESSATAIHSLRHEARDQVYTVASIDGHVLRSPFGVLGAEVHGDQRGPARRARSRRPRADRARKPPASCRPVPSAAGGEAAPTCSGTARPSTRAGPLRERSGPCPRGSSPLPRRARRRFCSPARDQLDPNHRFRRLAHQPAGLEFDQLPLARQRAGHDHDDQDRRRQATPAPRHRQPPRLAAGARGCRQGVEQDPAAPSSRARPLVRSSPPPPGQHAERDRQQRQRDHDQQEDGLHLRRSRARSSAEREFVSARSSAAPRAAASASSPARDRCWPGTGGRNCWRSRCRRRRSRASVAESGAASASRPSIAAARRRGPRSRAGAAARR